MNHVGATVYSPANVLPKLPQGALTTETISIRL